MLNSEVIGPTGSGGPLETGHVICPACAHNFPAIPENARDRIAELKAALRAIMEAHGPGTLASEEIYEQAVAALNGPRPVEE